MGSQTLNPDLSQTLNPNLSEHLMPGARRVSFSEAVETAQLPDTSPPDARPAAKGGSPTWLAA